MSAPHIEPSSISVALLMGGPSREREVSLHTGRAVEGALRRLGYRVEVIDPERDLADRLSALSPNLVFNALHGTYGEDGVVQGLLEWLQIPYTGSKLTASALAMDKGLTLSVCERAGIPVPDGFTWSARDVTPLPDALYQLTPNASEWIVKPVNEGSSVGLHHCTSAPALIETLESKRDEQPHAVQEWRVEEYVAGVEVSVVIFEGEVWGSVEVSPESGLYDYAAKYERRDTHYFCPPRLSDDTIARIEGLGLAAYRALKCVGVCRADFIHRSSAEADAGAGLAAEVLLELNTLPGMTETSLVPKVAAARGVPFDELIEQIVRAELSREVTS